MKQVREGSGGRGVAIFDVDASPEVVWSVITSFSSYPKWIEEALSANDMTNKESISMSILSSQRGESLSNIILIIFIVHKMDI